MVLKRNARLKYYRLFKKITSALDVLHAEGRISSEEKADLIARSEELYSEWRRQMREARKPFLRRPGRPKLTIDRNKVHPTCKAEKCENPSAPEQVYCSRKCAPLGYFGRGWK